MSDISNRIMRGQYVSKAECFDHAEEIERTMDAYGPAMAAMEAHECLMRDCRCSWDIDWEGRGVNTPPAGGCPVHPVESEDAE